MAESSLLVFWGKSAPRVESRACLSGPTRMNCKGCPAAVLWLGKRLVKGASENLRYSLGRFWGTVTLSRPPGTAPTVAKVKRTSSEREVSAQGSPCRNWDSSSGLCSLYSVRSQIEVFTLAHLPPTDSKELVNHTLKRGRIFPRCHWNVFWN